MTSPEPGEPESLPPDQGMPWMQPTTELPTQPAGRRRIIVLLMPVIVLLVLCCGGAALTTAFFRGDTPKTGSPTLVVPSSQAAPPPPAPSPSPSPSPPSPSPSRTSKPPTRRPTTHKPKPTVRPTTRKPTPSPPVTIGPVQQNVRTGQFCGPRGAIGITRRGQVLRCGPGIDDPRDRWRPMT